MDYSINTKCVQAGYTPGNGEPRQIPIIQSTTFKYDTSEDMGKLFDLEASGYFYSRLQNPTNDYVAAKIAELEGGAAAMLTSSGQAANFFALFNICECGSHIVASSSIYGGTYNLIAAAASFIAELRKRGYKVLKAKNDVEDGIRMVGTMLNQDKIKFSSACVNTQKEFASYVWDEKAAQRGEDKPVKQKDHAMDALRYFVATILGNRLATVKVARR